MIYKIIVDLSAQPDALKVEFRRRLMTGGAVVRLASGLDASALEVLAARFEPTARTNNLSSLVLEQIASADACGAQLEGRLFKLGLGNVCAAISKKAARAT